MPTLDLVLAGFPLIRLFSMSARLDQGEKFKHDLGGRETLISGHEIAPAGPSKQLADVKKRTALLEHERRWKDRAERMNSN